MRLGSLVLILTGAAILGIGAIVGVIGGVGELAYYQCVENGSAPCTTTGSNQYVTVFLANNDLLTIGMNVLLVGVLILLAGIVTLYMPTVSHLPGMAPDLSHLGTSPMQPSVNPVRQCTKCGAQAVPGHKFCAVCGNSLA
jgi:hypothetical protein